MTDAERLALLQTVAVHEHKGRPYYVCLGEIPAPWQDAFRAALRGSACPGSTAEANALMSGTGPTGCRGDFRTGDRCFSASIGRASSRATEEWFQRIVSIKQCGTKRRRCKPNAAKGYCGQDGAIRRVVRRVHGDAD
jgi:hypothetical protein